MPTTSPAVELILARPARKRRLPRHGQDGGTVSALTSSEDTSISALADTVLQDYGLAQKLLRLVNTLAYAQHGQVTTVSRAVLLMGFDRVRTVATGLMLFEHLQAQAKSPALVDALNMSFYSAILGRSIADEIGIADREETFISALFHNLGRTLVALYLPAEVKAIRAEAGTEPGRAVLRVLGMSYTSIGVAVARALNLPERLLQSMNRVPGSQAHASMTDEEKLGALATLSNGVADALATQASPKVKKQAIERLVKSYGAQFAALDGKTMDTLIAGAETELHEHSKTFRLDLEGSTFASGLSEFKADAIGLGERRPHLQHVGGRRPGRHEPARSAGRGIAGDGADAGPARGHQPARRPSSRSTTCSASFSRPSTARSASAARGRSSC